MSNNAAIGKAVTGHFPSEFKRINGISKRARTRDHYVTGQLGGVLCLEKCNENLAEECAGNLAEFNEKFQTMTEAMALVCKTGGLHGKCIEGPPPKRQRKAIAAPMTNNGYTMTVYQQCNQ